MGLLKWLQEYPFCLILAAFHCNVNSCALSMFVSVQYWLHSTALLAAVYKTLFKFYPLGQVYDGTMWDSPTDHLTCS